MRSAAAQAEYINMQPLLLPCSLPFFMLPSLPFFSYCCSFFSWARKIYPLYLSSLASPIWALLSFCCHNKDEKHPWCLKRRDSSSVVWKSSSIAQSVLESERWGKKKKNTHPTLFLLYQDISQTLIDLVLNHFNMQHSYWRQPWSYALTHYTAFIISKQLS